MIRVQFNDSPKMINANFSSANDEITLAGDKVKPDTSGFKTYQLNGSFLGDYSEYKTIVEVGKGYVKFKR